MRTLGIGARMFLSVDGKSLYASGESANHQIGFYRVDLYSGDAKLLDDGNGFREMSADGAYYYIPGGADGRQILVTSTATKKSRVVYQADGKVRTLALSPDGKRIAFIAGDYDEEHPSPLLLLDIGSGAVRKLDEGWYTSTGAHVAWSPDGKFLVAYGRRGSSKRNPELALVPADGGTVKSLGREVFASDTRISDIAVHPNGKSVSWTSARRTFNYWVIEK